MTGRLDMGVVTENVVAVIEVGYVTVVSRVRGHSLRWDESAVGEGYHGGVLLGIVGVEVPRCDLTVVSSASLWETKLIYIR